MGDLAPALWQPVRMDWAQAGAQVAQRLLEGTDTPQRPGRYGVPTKRTYRSVPTLRKGWRKRRGRLLAVDTGSKFWGRGPGQRQRHWS